MNIIYFFLKFIRKNFSSLKQNEEFVKEIHSYVITYKIFPYKKGCTSKLSLQRLKLTQIFSEIRGFYQKK